MTNKIKVCYALSYKSPKYIRTRVLLNALQSSKSVYLLTAINKQKNGLRYLETLLKILYIRIRYRPDVYILGFRGHEILLPVRIITLGKPLIFDEFIILNDWLTKEHKKIKISSALNRLLKFYMKTSLRFTEKILSDTKSHADRSSQLYNTLREKYHTIYVGTDENVFYPRKKGTKRGFKVLFYGTALPLHGIEVILEAAKKLLKQEDITLTLIGGKNKPEMIQKIKTYIKKNNITNIDYRTWVDFSELPNIISNMDLCLGGPFGGTSQAEKVITGKTFQFLAMQKPTLIGKISEDVGFRDKRNCLLIKQGSSTELANTIDWAYHNQTQLNSIAEKGRELYEQNFSNKAVMKKMEVIIHNLDEK